MAALAVLALLACDARKPSVVAAAPVHDAQPAACRASAATERLLRGLRQRLVIEAFATRGDVLERTLGALADASRSVEVRTVDRARADELGIKTRGVAFAYGAERDVIPEIESADDGGLELWIAMKISELRDKADAIHHRIGVLVGHGEISLGEANLLPAAAGKPSVREIITRNFPTFEFVDVDLRGGAQPIDETLEGLVVTEPERDLTTTELRRIDDFVMHGRALVVLAGAANMRAGDTKMLATLSTHGLERLLDGYGIELHRDVVLDFERSFQLSAMTQSGVATVRFPAILEVDRDRLDASFLPFFRLERLEMPFVSSLAIHPEKQPSATLKVVARSSAKATLDASDALELGLRTWKPRGEYRQRDIAAYAQGKMHSAFGASSVPDGATARVLVVSAAQMTANPFARAGNPGDAVLLQMATSYGNMEAAPAPLLDAILFMHNTLEAIALDPALAELATRAPCR
ncbi:MAG TPA: Gldg family protein [Polyangiaceae bacterium]